MQRTRYIIFFFGLFVATVLKAQTSSSSSAEEVEEVEEDGQARRNYFDRKVYSLSPTDAYLGFLSVSMENFSDDRSSEFGLGAGFFWMERTISMRIKKWSKIENLRSSFVFWYHDKKYLGSTDRTSFFIGRYFDISRYAYKEQTFGGLDEVHKFYLAQFACTAGVLVPLSDTFWIDTYVGLGIDYVFGGEGDTKMGLAVPARIRLVFNFTD